MPLDYHKFKPRELKPSKIATQKKRLERSPNALFHIQIRLVTRDRLRDCCKQGETVDETISRLIDSYLA